MNFKFEPLVNLYVLQALVKGFTVFYFVLLPVFYAEKFINSTELGYIGALFIVLLIIGAVIVSGFLHNLKTKKLLEVSSFVTIFSSFALLISVLDNNIILLIISFSLTGLAVGIAQSGVNVLAASLTTRGDRYKSLANLGIPIDLIRIVFPLIVSGTVVLGYPILSILLIIIASLIFFIFSFNLSFIPSAEESVAESVEEGVRSNKNFLYVLLLEFFDSFASSQLFVFLPLVFLAKGYSLENSLLLQSFVFLGYLLGRRFVSILARKYSGIKAVSYSEMGMVITILLFLISNNIFILYTLCFILGIFARGTSPTIKALAFDTLTEKQMKKGSALHVVAGDSGSALGQFIFGLLIAWYGVTSPFFASAGVALFIGILTLLKPVQIYKIEH
jgi:MFS transporter, FSR family, fosmidomycin resistance protein